MSLPADQKDLPGAIQGLETACNHLRYRLLAERGIEERKPTLKSGDDMESLAHNYRALESELFALTQRLSTPATPVQSPPQTPQLPAPLTEAELMSLNLTERILYSGGKLPIAECRERIAVREVQKQRREAMLTGKVVADVNVTEACKVARTVK